MEGNYILLRFCGVKSMLCVLVLTLRVLMAILYDFCVFLLYLKSPPPPIYPCICIYPSLLLQEAKDSPSKAWGGDNGFDAVVIASGGKDDIAYKRSATMQLWLFGYELTDTIFVFGKNEFLVISSPKKRR
jgi:FACT complex subunit SPT16 N-terminal lobe domain